MDYNKIYVKEKIIKHLLLNGKKQIGEKLLLKTFKELQKNSLKNCKKLLNLAIISCIPVFKLHKLVKRKKISKEIPAIISNKKVRVSLAIKFILLVLKNKNVKNFYTKFYTEIMVNLKNKGLAIQMNKKAQKQALLKKHFFYYYR